MDSKKKQKLKFPSVLSDSSQKKVIDQYKANNFIITEQAGKFGLNSLEGERKLERVYDHVEYFRSPKQSSGVSVDYYIYSKDNKYGVFSANPYFSLPMNFTSLDSLKKVVRTISIPESKETMDPL